jgi:osmotically-inducible protein OsmY
MRFFSITLLLALILTPLFAQKSKTAISDDMLVDQVRVKLASDSEVGGQPIQVDVHKGMVVLTGKVTSEKLKNKAEKIAKKVKGVAGVEDKIVISPE